MAQVVASTAERPASRWALGIPFLLVHVAVIGVFFVGVSPIALVVAAISYVTRAFGITGFYHRCLSHRSFKVPRAVQFVGATLGAAAAQRGPLWWVAHHRKHHRYTDVAGDVHSPVVDSWLYSHVLWIFDPKNASTDHARVRDLERFGELRVLDRFEHLAPGALLVTTFALGALFGHFDPRLGTSAFQMAEWGFVIPTVVLWHSTFSVNSIAHKFGRRRFEVADASRNNWFVAALVLGEGWHNNHHRFPNSSRQGIGRFELDPTYWGIRMLAAIGLASSLRQPPAWAMAGASQAPAAERVGGLDLDAALALRDRELESVL